MTTQTIPVTRPRNSHDWHISREDGTTYCGKRFKKGIAARTENPMSVECEACRDTYVEQR